jgi:hypothetical protein
MGEVLAPPEATSKVLASLPERPARALDEKLAARLVQLSLQCVDREYPNKPSNVLAGNDEVVPPRKLHPAFFGCFDWHSAVHGHWTMVRVLKLFPKIESAKAIRRKLDRHLSPQAIRGEVGYLEAKHHHLFERPYGWGWLLRLAAELRTWEDPDAKRWSAALAPLERLLARRTIDYLGRLSTPVRAGTHHSTAFALAHIHDYAEVSDNAELRQAIARAGRRFYLADRDCPVAYEPSGEDFISPCLAEADLMRRILRAGELRPWLDRFMPELVSPRSRSLLHPPEVRDRKDPKIGHLIGLSMQRTWTMKGLAGALPRGDPRAKVLRRSAALHQHDSLRLMFDSGYGGAHWLASFAVFMLDTPVYDKE